MSGHDENIQELINYYKITNQNEELDLSLPYRELYKIVYNQDYDKFLKNKERLENENNLRDYKSIKFRKHLFKKKNIKIEENLFPTNFTKMKVILSKEKKIPIVLNLYIKLNSHMTEFILNNNHVVIKMDENNNIIFENINQLNFYSYKIIYFNAIDKSNKIKLKEPKVEDLKLVKELKFSTDSISNNLVQIDREFYNKLTR